MFLEAMWQWEEATFKKKGWRGVGGEGAAPPPRCMGCLCMCCFFSVIVVFFFLCFFFVMFLEALWQWEEATFEKKGWRGVGGRAQRLPPRCFGCLCMCCFFSVIFVFFLCFFFVMFLEAMWQCRRQPLKKKAGGGCIGCLCMCCFFCYLSSSCVFSSSQRLPPDAWGVFACVVFFLSLLSSSCVFSSWCSWKQCGSERRQPFSFHGFFLRRCRLAGFFWYQFPRTLAALAGGQVGSGGEHWPYMIAADVQRIILAYTPHSTSQFVRYRERWSGEWCITLANFFSQWHPAMAFSQWHPAMAPSNGTS